MRISMEAANPLSSAAGIASDTPTMAICLRP